MAAEVSLGWESGVDRDSTGDPGRPGGTLVEPEDAVWWTLLACDPEPGRPVGDHSDTASPAHSSGGESGGPDSDPSESARPDSGAADTGTLDTALPDTACPDSGVADTACPDSGEPPRTVWNIDERGTGYLLGTDAEMRLGDPGHLVLLPDLDGDGLPEVVAGGGAPGAAGDAWLVDGPAAAAAAGSVADHGFAHLTGEADVHGYYYQPTRFTATTGDLDGDGFDDLPVGASYDYASYTVYTFACGYVLRGGALGGDLPMSSADYRFGTDDDSRQQPVSTALVDIDGDGLADVVIGTPESWASASTDAGALHVFLAPGLAPGLAPLDAADFFIEGVDAISHLGDGLAAADLDGDGYADLLATAPLLDTDAGSAGGVYGIPGMAVAPTWASIDTVATLRVVGVSAAQAVGTDPLPRAGDVDGSGQLDLGLGNVATGQAWLFLDPGLGGELTVDDADYAFSGDAGAFARGLALDSDLDGDGRDEVAVGIAADATPGSVAIFAFDSAWASALSVDDAQARLEGVEPTGELGASLAGGLDVDGDGRDDIAVGSPGDARAATEAGAIWIVPGW